VRYLKSFLVGLGMYLLAVVAWDEFGWMFITPRDLQIYNSYVMHTPIIGQLIGIAAFVGGFYWMFRRTSAQRST
jgi:hypothetical protein